MALFTALRKASFRGVPFGVTSGDVELGRRLARHEYPQRDIPWLEDMGRKAREYKIEALISGPNYRTERDALIAALETVGPGQLVHPWHGTVRVTVSTVSLSESTESGGLARFSITFIEVGAAFEPRVEVDTLEILNQRYTAALDTFLGDFSAAFTVKSLPEFAVAGTFDAVIALVTKVSSPVTSAATGLSSFPSSLLYTPATLGAALQDLIMTTDGSETRVLDFSLPDAETPYPTATRLKIIANRRALSALANATATAKTIRTLSETAPKTLDDARTARKEITRVFDALLLDPAVAQASADATAQLVSDAIAHYMALTPTLPRIARVIPLADLPALVTAHDFYGDDWLVADREAEIVARNAIRHPGLVSAGYPLELIT
ncbi:MAG: DNA circularization N-terminal domain-containing protein [Candidatus Accumulibacter sp.]|jgi:prophage DNA circulation protein|nr:DNA circularization N-terminal domain-containing protein [Accumulibacter sp.]